MARNTYEIKNKGLTILVEQAYDGRGKFEFVGLIKDNEPDKIWTQYGSSNNEAMKGKEMMSMNKFLSELLKEQADIQLSQYVAKNINRFEFYFKDNEEGKNIFFNKRENYSNEYPRIEQSMNTDLSDIVEGIVVGTVSGHRVTYNFLLGKFTEIITQHDHNKNPKTELQIFYGSYLDKIVAIEQYKKGLAHKAYTELVKLSEFLEGKKSVKINLNDGRVIELKDDKINAADVINFFDGDNTFTVNDSYDMKPRLGKHYSITELESLQFGKNIYKINNSNLILN